MKKAQNMASWWQDSAGGPVKDRAKIATWLIDFYRFFIL